MCIHTQRAPSTPSYIDMMYQMGIGMMFAERIHKSIDLSSDEKTLQKETPAPKQVLQQQKPVDREVGRLERPSLRSAGSSAVLPGSGREG